MKHLKFVIALLVLALAACSTPSQPATPTKMTRAISSVPSQSITPTVASSRPSSSTPPNALITHPNVTTQQLLDQARTANAARVKFANDQGAQIVPTSDGRSFYVLWIPSNWRGTIIVTLHGHDSWAFDEFFLWQSFAAQRGHAILALQWWLGAGEQVGDYYLPQEIYPMFETALRQQKIQTGKALLHGFSRGAANIYSVTLYDRQSRNNFFGLTIANAGMASPDFPPNIEITNGKFGTNVYAGTHWVLFCGEQDPEPDRAGCPAMRKTRDWLTQFGGTVDLLIDDPNGDHGGFHRNAANVNAALDVFDRLLAAK